MSSVFFTFYRMKPGRLFWVAWLFSFLVVWAFLGHHPVQAAGNPFPEVAKLAAPPPDDSLPPVRLYTHYALIAAQAIQAPALSIQGFWGSPQAPEGMAGSEAPGNFQQALLYLRQYVDVRRQTPGIQTLTSLPATLEPGTYKLDMPVLLSDSLVLGGDSLAEFFFFRDGNLDVDRLKLYVSGFSPERVHFVVEGALRVTHSSLTGNWLARDSIVFPDSSEQYGACFSEGTIRFSKPGSVSSTHSVAHNGTPDWCTAAQLSLNRLCNPGFTNNENPWQLVTIPGNSPDYYPPGWNWRSSDWDGRDQILNAAYGIAGLLNENFGIEFINQQLEQYDYSIPSNGSPVLYFAYYSTRSARRVRRYTLPDISLVGPGAVDQPALVTQSFLPQDYPTAANASIWTRVGGFLWQPPGTTADRIRISIPNWNRPLLAGIHPTVSPWILPGQENSRTYMFVDNTGLVRIPTDVVVDCNPDPAEPGYRVRHLLDAAVLNFLISRGARWSVRNAQGYFLAGPSAQPQLVVPFPVNGPVSLFLTIGPASTAIRSTLDLPAGNANYYLEAVTNPVCEGQPLQVVAMPMGDPLVNPTWIDPQGSVIGTSRILNVPARLTHSGTIRFSAIVGGCYTERSLSVTVLPKPGVQIAGPTRICPGRTVTLTGTGASSLVWNTGTTGPVQTVTQPGNFVLTGTDPNGCSSQISHSVLPGEVPQITFPQPVSVCPEPTSCGTPLLALPAGGSWSGDGIYHQGASQCPIQGAVFNSPYLVNGAPNSGLAPGLYPLVYSVYSSDGCLAKATLMAEVRHPFPLDFQVFDPPLCPGKVLTLNASSSLPFPQTASLFWSIADWGDYEGNNPEVGWPVEGDYPVRLDIRFSGSDNSDGFCPNTIQKVIPIRPATVFLGIKGRVGEEIALCAGTPFVELETEMAEGATYVWEDITNPSQPVLLSHDPIRPWKNTIPVPEPGPGQQTVVRAIRVTIQTYQGCLAKGRVTLIKSQPQFQGSPNVFYYEPVQSLAVENPETISICTGNWLTLYPNGVDYTGSQELVYKWTGPGLTGLETGSLELKDLEPGSYTYQLQAFEIGGNQCGSAPREVTVVVGDPNPVEVNAIPVTGYPNDMDLQIRFTPQNASEVMFFRDETHLESLDILGGEAMLNLYDPTPSHAFCREDGVYSLRVFYQNGCVARKTFTLLGKKTYENPSAIYTGSRSFSGLVFVHHSVDLRQGNFRFSQADVRVRGMAEAIEEGSLTPFSLPGTISGNRIRVSGVNSRLDIRQSTFSSANDRMWEGIDADEIGSIQTTDLAGSQSLPVVISDARLGLSVTRPFRDCQLLDIQFRNCLQGLRLEDVVENPPYFVRMNRCKVSCDPLEMKKPFHSRGPKASQNFVTRLGLQFSGKTRIVNQPESGSNQFPIQDLEVDNCLEGIRLDLDPRFSPGQVDLNGVRLQNFYQRGMAALSGKLVVNNGHVLFPPQIPGLYDLVAGSLDPTPPRTCEGVYSTGDLDLKGVEFRSQDLGSHEVESFGIVQDQNGGTTQVSIRGNTFIDLKNAISLRSVDMESNGEAQMEFALKCNRFKLTCSETSPSACDGEAPRKGLTVGYGVKVLTRGANGLEEHVIGGDGAYEPGSLLLNYPNANEWPVRYDFSGPNRANFPENFLNIQDSWVGPTNWTSLENSELNSGLRYWRYKNEFVWGGGLESALFETSSSPKFTRTLGTPENPNVQFEFTCQNLISTPEPIFPARMSVVATNKRENGKEGNSKSCLGEPFPNPSSGSTKLPCFLTFEEKFALLQLVDLPTGRVLKSQVLTERGQLIFTLEDLKPGLYAIQVVLENSRLSSKRLVVTQ